MKVLIKMTYYRMIFRKKGRLKIKSLSTRILTYITQGTLTLTDRRQKKKNKEKTHTHTQINIRLSKKKQFFSFLDIHSLFFNFCFAYQYRTFTIKMYTWRKTKELTIIAIEMTENLVDVMMNYNVRVLIYATFQSIDQVI